MILVGAAYAEGYKHESIHDVPPASDLSVAVDFWAPGVELQVDATEGTTEETFKFDGGKFRVTSGTSYGKLSFGACSSYWLIHCA